MNTTTDIRDTATYRAVDLANRFESVAAGADTRAEFDDHLTTVRQFALGVAAGATAQVQVIATYFAQRVEATSAQSVAAIVDGATTDEWIRFQHTSTGMHMEAARGFATVVGLPTAHIAPIDYATLSRYYLHVINSRMEK